MPVGPAIGNAAGTGGTVGAAAAGAAGAAGGCAGAGAGAGDAGACARAAGASSATSESVSRKLRMCTKTPASAARRRGRGETGLQPGYWPSVMTLASGTAAFSPLSLM
jgi:hypothetical protein